jgi:phosphatidylglycerophosphate synthase
MKTEFESSLKSVETENALDLHFYRPIGYHIARTIRNTGITPNMITILSVFVGAGSGYLFYFDTLAYSLFGILLMVLANILDCVDGQLARLTNRKSEFGRILDGVAGDIWFILIYTGLALQLSHTYGSGWFFLPAVISGLSHLVQANITDYYKTLHLYFESKEKGREFQNMEKVKAQKKAMNSGISKLFYLLYEGYTGLQEHMTPVLQRLLKEIHTRFGDDIPEAIRVDFRRQSCHLMKRYINAMTFNGRTIVLFVVILCAPVWVYFIYEAVALNFILFLSIRKHEKMCGKINAEITLAENV